MNDLLINKYKPIIFDNYKTNIKIINILKLLITIDKLNILLIGNSGTGKTSLLNTIIKEYYQDNNYTNNVLYINNLNEQGINFYRTEVKNFCRTYSSVPNKKKFLILDDLDLINEQSQQIFSNCLDKYYKNVFIISSCNNIHKINECLQSRLTIIKLNNINYTILNNIFEEIIVKEKLTISPDAKIYLIKLSNNNIKVLLNYVEKIKLLNIAIDIDIINNLCTHINYDLLEQYSVYIKQKNLHKAIQILYNIYYKGFSVMDILSNYYSYLNITNIFDENNKYKIILYISKYINIFNSIHENEIELALFTNNLIKHL
jgi:DNA polymerase III delta prime subunit